MKALDISANAVDTRLAQLANIAPPSALQQLDYESLLDVLKAQLQVLLPDDIVVNELSHSDPLLKILDVLAYRELYARQKINDAIRGACFTTAKGEHLDQLAKLLGLSREQGQSDQALRRSILTFYLTPHTAGPRQHYQAFAKAVAGVKDVYIELDRQMQALQQDDLHGRALPAKINISIWCDTDNAAEKERVLAQVRQRIDAVRPVTDWVEVQDVRSVAFQIDADIKLASGVGEQEAKLQILKHITEYILNAQRLGSQIKRSEILAAMHQQGVANVNLSEPAADITFSGYELAVLNYDGAPGNPLTASAIDALLMAGDQPRIRFSDTNSMTQTIVKRLPPQRLLYQQNQQVVAAKSSDSASQAGVLGIELQLTGAKDEQHIDAYAVYWGSDATTRLGATPITRIATDENATGNVYSRLFFPNLQIPVGATHILAFSIDSLGEMEEGIGLEIYDRAVPTSAPRNLSFESIAFEPVAPESVSIAQPSATSVADRQADRDYLSGALRFDGASDESRISHYALYWSDAQGRALAADAQQSTPAPIQRIVKDASLADSTQGLTYLYHFQRAPIPAGATQLLLRAANAVGEMQDGATVSWLTS